MAVALGFMVMLELSWSFVWLRFMEWRMPAVLCKAPVIQDSSFTPKLLQSSGGLIMSGIFLKSFKLCFCSFLFILSWSHTCWHLVFWECYFTSVSIAKWPRFPVQRWLGVAGASQRLQSRPQTFSIPARCSVRQGLSGNGVCWQIKSKEWQITQ